MVTKDGKAITGYAKNDSGYNKGARTFSVHASSLSEFVLVALDGPPTVITLSSFTAEAKSNKVVLKWQTGTEIDNIGFNILRSESESDGYVKINKKIIPAKGSATKGAGYNFADEKVKAGKIYYYKLEDIDSKTGSTLHGPKSVKISFKKKGKK